jgi:hypothetical protein
MKTTAKLDELIDALDEQSDDLFAFLDRETGAVELISDESLSLSESEPEEIASLPEWQQEEAERAILIETTDRYLALPSQFDVNEWNIMNEFCHEIPQEDIRNRFLGVIHGNHAFRRFKDKIADFDMSEEWNRFRRAAFEEIIRDWCEENGIALAVQQKQAVPPRRFPGESNKKH